MKCYAHPQTDAVGSCVSCGQGLCGECVKRTASGQFVCGEPCRKLANMKNVAVEFEIEGVRLQQRSYVALAALCRAMALVLLLLVLALLGFAVYEYRIPSPGRMELVGTNIAGAFVFFLFAAMMIFAANSLRKIGQRYGEILKKVDDA